MNRASRCGAFLGALLLGASCGPDLQQPPESESYPVPEYVSPGDVTSLVSGFSWDPEAFFMNLAFCGGPACPIPPFLLDESPLYQRSAVRNATIAAFDPKVGAPAVAPVRTDGLGMWTIPAVPSRTDVPYFITALPTGELPTEVIGPPLPPVPQGGYVPTVTLRPVVTHNSVCAVQEAANLSTVGILDAVARYLTSKGTPTSVADFVNPAKFSNVVVFWLYQPGSPLLRVPADGTTIEASAGQVLHLEWAPPGVPPAELRSARGFMVAEGSLVSPLGLSVVLLRAGAGVPPVVTYSVRDPSSNEALSRPWFFPPIVAPPTPGVVNFAGNQLWRADQPNGPAGPTPPMLCLPQQ
jgi:hypothetical protein